MRRGSGSDSSIGAFYRVHKQTTPIREVEAILGYHRVQDRNDCAIHTDCIMDLNTVDNCMEHIQYHLGKKLSVRLIRVRWIWDHRSRSLCIGGSETRAISSLLRCILPVRNPYTYDIMPPTRIYSIPNVKVWQKLPARVKRVHWCGSATILTSESINSRVRPTNVPPKNDAT
jgi:hypothetical protein